jgi:hypothetical protein
VVWGNQLLRCNDSVQTLQANIRRTSD